MPRSHSSSSIFERRLAVGSRAPNLFVAQRAPQYFADVGLRQIVAKLDDSRPLVIGQVLAAMVEHVLFGDASGRCARQTASRFRRSARPRADGSGLQDAVHLDDDVFNFIGINVETGHQDHVFLAILDKE